MGSRAHPEPPGTGVTAGYSHGYPLEQKRELLGKWVAHVEELVQPPPSVTAENVVALARRERRSRSG